MKTIVHIILGFGLLLVLSGCQTTRSDSPGSDYRAEEASHQTERDTAAKKTRRPLDHSRQDRQEVIDRPR